MHKDSSWEIASTWNLDPKDDIDRVEIVRGLTPWINYL